MLGKDIGSHILGEATRKGEDDILRVHVLFHDHSFIPDLDQAVLAQGGECHELVERGALVAWWWSLRSRPAGWIHPLFDACLWDNIPGWESLHEFSDGLGDALCHIEVGVIQLKGLVFFGITLTTELLSELPEPRNLLSQQCLNILDRSFCRNQSL